MRTWVRVGSIGDLLYTLMVGLWVPHGGVLAARTMGHLLTGQLVILRYWGGGEYAFFQACFP